MPELPEVESIARDLDRAGLTGRTITDVTVRWKRSVAAPSPGRFVKQLAGLRIETIGRRGKFIVIGLSGGMHLLVHLRMSGRLFFGASVSEAHDRVVFRLDDGRLLRFSDTRKFGRMWLVRDVAQVLGKLGPEPLDTSLTLRRFHENLHKRSRLLKPLLLDQTFIAGLGNIYVDEALWEAGLHPLRQSNTLSPEEAAALLKAIRKVIRKGIRNLGTSLGNGITNFQLPGGERGRNREQLMVYRQTGLPCKHCGAAIERIVVGQRSTHMCPRCQR